MNALTEFLSVHGTAILGGSGAMVFFVAWARHIPTWPLTPAKLWEWFRGTAQEVASQRSGQAIEQPSPLVPPSDSAQPPKQ